MARSLILILLLLWSARSRASMFGEESVPLWKLVAGQVAELEHLAQVVNAAKEQRDFIMEINQGVQKATHQIETIQSIIERAKNLDPSSVKNLADLTARIEEMKGVLTDASEILELKLALCDQAIGQSAIQSETAYKMGQEMVGTGSTLAEESKDASPGRAQQISAAAASSQMLATGVELQTLAQLTQLQAMSLELQKSQLKRDGNAEQARRSFFMQSLGDHARSGRNRP